MTIPDEKWNDLVKLATDADWVGADAAADWATCALIEKVLEIGQAPEQ